MRTVLTLERQRIGDEEHRITFDGWCWDCSTSDGPVYHSAGTTVRNRLPKPEPRAADEAALA